MDEKKEREIENLVAMAKKGDTDAFASLYDMLIAPVYRYIYFKVDKNDVEDLTELVFLRVWENIHQYKKRKTSFSSWVFRIAHNLVVDHYRLKRDIMELDTNIQTYERSHNPISKAEDALNHENLKRALSSLKDSYRQVLVLRFLEELSNKEIAEVMKKSEGGLRILQMRALRALRETLKDMGIKY